MNLSELTALSPIDGRYRQQVQHLYPYFSEYGLMKYRVWVEVEYFLFLADKKFFHANAGVRKKLKMAVAHFSVSDAGKIKETEAITKHDVKAVEYFIKDLLSAAKADTLKEWVHFGLTSQDINNTAIPLLWKHALENEYLPPFLNLIRQLKMLASDWKDIPMLARTHGQPASPTKLGKELMVFVERLESQVDQLISLRVSGKFGGATGNFNAHHVAFPRKNWIALGNTFLEKNLGLKRQQFTTQIEHYDNLAAHFDVMRRINTILIDMVRDLWTYISLDYFKQKTKPGEVGSSAMPHKVNPIDFENAEGNFGVANALWEHLSAKLPISRLQRDLTDSTVLRNIGVPFAHTILAFKSVEKGLGKLKLNDEKIYADLDQQWSVVAEAIQTILRREKYPQPYEALKALTRGKNGINQQTLHAFIEGLPIPQKVKKELKSITPHNYTGIQPSMD